MNTGEALTQSRDWRIRFQSRAHIAVMIFIALIFGFVWFYLTKVVGVPFYKLPAPDRVVQAFLESIDKGVWGRFSHIRNLAFTLKTCLIGYAIGAFVGLLLGILTGEFRWFSTAIMPYISALQSLPKLTLAPLMIVWFGIGEPSKIATAALLTFFPLMINTYTGLMSVDPDMIDMMRSLNATRAQIFLKVRFPNSLPLIFTGLQMSIVYALLGTMLGEFLAGDTGLGMQIRDSLYTMETASMFSMMFLLTITGFVLQEIIRVIKRRLVFWSEMIELAST